ncbi:MAG TPA: MBOAT family O-acyltransferase [Bdellovibrionota bacterium]|nr:MBOAT family O-acyltransferase [Bdellovibrionota bacterium]
MAIASFDFLLLVFGAIILLNLSNREWQKGFSLAAVNLVFILSFLPLFSHGIAIFLFLTYGYLLVWVSQRRPRGVVITFQLVSTILFFVFLKKYSILDRVPQIPTEYTVVGLSYFLFRLIHLLVDVSQGAINERITIIRYFNYMCLFLTFLSGPIQRYQDYAKQDDGLGRLELTDKEVLTAFGRILMGYLELLVICSLIQKMPFSHSQNIANLALGIPLGSPAWVISFALASASYTLFLYINFRGYMDVVVGFGTLAGFRLPENFNAPFAASNFLDFWSRWHITLSDWFRTYLFNPLLRKLTDLTPRAAARSSLGVIAFFVTFVLMGLWHGSTGVFLFYGLFLGIGVAVNKLYQNYMQARMRKTFYKRICANDYYKALCTGGTFAYFSIALVCVWGTDELYSRVLSVMGVLCVIGAFLLLTFLAGVIVAASRYLSTALRERVLAPVQAFCFSPGFAHFYLGSMLFALVTVLVLGKRSVEFVYKAF